MKIIIVNLLIFCCVSLRGDLIMKESLSSSFIYESDKDYLYLHVGFADNGNATDILTIFFDVDRKGYEHLISMLDKYTEWSNTAKEKNVSSFKKLLGNFKCKKIMVKHGYLYGWGNEYINLSTIIKSFKKEGILEVPMYFQIDSEGKTSLEADKELLGKIIHKYVNGSYYIQSVNLGSIDIGDISLFDKYKAEHLKLEQKENNKDALFD